MKREVEILVEILDTKKVVLQKLKKFHQQKNIDIKDIYFYDPKRRDLQPGKNNRLVKCLRLRQKGKLIYVTYKKDYFKPNDIWTHSDEHEVQVSNFNETKEILQKLGFKILVQIDSHKVIYENNEFEIIFEEVKNLGNFLEIESRRLVEKGEVIAEKEKIWYFMKNLKLNISQELNSGKPELMLKSIKLNHAPDQLELVYQ